MHGKKKIRSEFEFIGLKNIRLNYKCKECNETYAKLVNDLSKSFQERINFAMVMLINLFCYKEKVFILMSIWIVREDLMKHHYHLKIFL